MNLVRKGVVIDKLFESIIVEKEIKVDDIILGDKNMLLVTRILGYGLEYKIEITNSLGEPQEETIDLGKVQTKKLILKNFHLKINTNSPHHLETIN